MADDDSVLELFRRVRGGDEQAAAEIVRRYEPVIRRRVRVWLRMQDARLGRVFDSMDICQSVLASFFVRASAGLLDLDQPEQLVGLLYRMARHKLLHQVSRQHAQRRDVRRTDGAGFESFDPAGSADSPSQIVAGRELLDEVRRRLSPDELALADLRAQGQEWAEISNEMGGTAEARRKQLGRALDRVARELHLDEGMLEN